MENVSFITILIVINTNYWGSPSFSEEVSMVIVNKLRMITLKHGGLVGLHSQMIEEISIWSSLYFNIHPGKEGISVH